MSSAVNPPSVSATPIEPGAIIDQRYLVHSILGSGGMGCVFLVEDQQNCNQQLALKLLHPELTTNNALVQRFLREMQLMRQVDHQNVVRTFELSTNNGLVYFTMEYVKGKTLDSLIANSALKRRAVPGIIRQIAQALEAIHSAGIVHRDLKPGNIIVLDDRTIKLTDFGIARPKSSDMTMHNEILGSVCYIAPEIWLGEEPKPSCDLYSLGIIAYELTTGDVPFDGGTAHQLMRLHLDRSPIPPIEHDPQLSPWLNKLTLKLLEKSPADRFQDARELIEFIDLNCGGSAAKPAENEYRAFFELLEVSQTVTSEQTEMEQELRPEPAVLKPSLLKPTQVDPPVQKNYNLQTVAPLLALLAIASWAPQGGATLSSQIWQLLQLAASCMIPLCVLRTALSSSRSRLGGENPIGSSPRYFWGQWAGYFVIATAALATWIRSLHAGSVVALDPLTLAQATLELLAQIALLQPIIILPSSLAQHFAENTFAVAGEPLLLVVAALYAILLVSAFLQPNVHNQIRRLKPGPALSLISFYLVAVFCIYADFVSTATKDALGYGSGFWTRLAHLPLATMLFWLLIASLTVILVKGQRVGAHRH